MAYRYVGRCVELDGQDITDMAEKARKITRETFGANIGRENYLMLSDRLGYTRHHTQGLTLSKDYHVSFYRSAYRGKPCYYMVHSAIEHVFVKDEKPVIH
jgi:hypothetical protein